jgi:GntR family transcriptional regulator
MEDITRPIKTIMYQEVYNDLKAIITSKNLQEHDKLPTEFELCDNYNTSRITIRRALDELEKEGFIYKIRGKGTFVAPKQIVQNRSKFANFYSDVEDMGKCPSSKIVSFSSKLANEKVAEKMRLNEGDRIYELVWVRYADDEPLVYEKIHLPYDRMPGLERYDIANLKLYDILSKNYDVKMTLGQENFTLHSLTADEAIKLNKKKNDAVIKVERVIYENDAVIEFTESVVRGDRFIYSLEFEI